MADQKRVYQSDISTRIPPVGNKTTFTSWMKPPLNLMLLGDTGVGKSSFGNRLLDKDEAFSVPSSGAARGVIIKSGVVKGRQLTVTDTPSATSLNKDLLEAAFPPGTGISAFLLIFRLDKPHSADDEQSVKHLEHLFGTKFWSFAVLVFSHADSVANDRNRFLQRIEQRKKDSIPFALLMKKFEKKDFFMVQADSKSSVNDVSPSIMSAVEKIIGDASASASSTGGGSCSLYTKQDLLDALLKNQKEENARLEKRTNEVAKKRASLMSPP